MLFLSYPFPCKENDTQSSKRRKSARWHYFFPASFEKLGGSLWKARREVSLWMQEAVVLCNTFIPPFVTDMLQVKKYSSLNLDKGEFYININKNIYIKLINLTVIYISELKKYQHRKNISVFKCHIYCGFFFGRSLYKFSLHWGRNCNFLWK